MTLKAGLYGPEAIISSAGVPIKNTPVTVYKHGTTTAATLYTNETMSGTVSNPVDTTGRGNLTFYAAPGLYDLTVTITGTATTETVEVLPWTSTLSSLVQGSLPLFGVGGALYGDVAASGTPAFLVQAGVVTVNCTKANFIFDLPEAFPSAILACILTPLYGPDGGGGESDVLKVCQTTSGRTNASKVGGQVMRQDAAYTGTIALQYIAIGC